MPFTQSNQTIILMTRAKAFDKIKMFAKVNELVDIGKRSVEVLGAVDTGKMRDSIYGKIKFGEKDIKITLGVNDKVEKVRSVRNGTSTNTKYGKRDFLQYGIGAFVRYMSNLKAGSYLKTTSGNPRKSKSNKKSAIILKYFYNSINKPLGFRQSDYRNAISKMKK